jgi:hypothetical protein
MHWNIIARRATLSGMRPSKCGELVRDSLVPHGISLSDFIIPQLVTLSVVEEVATIGGNLAVVVAEEVAASTAEEEEETYQPLALKAAVKAANQTDHEEPELLTIARTIRSIGSRWGMI